MKNYIILALSILLNINICHSEDNYLSLMVGVVEDKDGYVNVRDKNGKIIDKLFSGKPVWAFELSEASEWVDVEYTKAGIWATGRIHGSRLKPLASFDKVNITHQTENSVTLEKYPIKITVSQKAFSKENKNFTYEKEGGFLTMINWKQIWGTDGNMPDKEYKSIEISIKNEKIIVPDCALEGLYQPNLSDTEAFYDPENNILYLASLNSDGAGGYVVVWVFRSGVYEDRLVVHGF